MSTASSFGARALAFMRSLHPSPLPNPSTEEVQGYLTVKTGLPAARPVARVPDGSFVSLIFQYSLVPLTDER